MRTTKLVFMVLIGLAMIEFSFGQSLNAAPSTKAPQPSLVAPKTTASSAGQSAKAKSAKGAKVAKTAKAAKTVKAAKIAHARKAAPSMKGLAAVYSDKLAGRKTSSGQKFCQAQMTAAHRSLPLGTKVLVTNVRNHKTVEVRINDRGPHHAGRVIDLTTAAAAKIGMKKTGNALVQLEIVRDSPTGKS